MTKRTKQRRSAGLVNGKVGALPTKPVGVTPTPEQVDAPVAPVQPLRLDIGCGPNKRQPNPGESPWTGVDRIAFPGVDVVCDLNRLWPWQDSTVAEIHCSHCIEHFDSMERVHIANEMYRVLVPGGKATVIAPHWASCRAYGDPTHKWPALSEFWFYYLLKDWRKANAPHTDAEHLEGGFSCNMEATWGYSMNQEIALRSQQSQQFALSFYKEAAQDIVATLTARK